MTSLWLDKAAIIPSDDFEADARYDEVIVGAGLTGLVTALLFARAGRRVLVLEARRVGSVTTGNTTAKLSQLQGAHLQKIKKHTYQAVLEAYVEANREGFSWLKRYAEQNDIPIQVRDAISYAGTPQGASVVQREYDVARSAGLDVSLLPETELPFATYGAVQLRDQVQFDPMDVAAALVADIRSHGGTIVEEARVTAVHAASDPARVDTHLGSVYARHVIVATGTPVLDRGLYFAKLTALRSYAAAFRVPGEIPHAMYLSVDSPSRSIRTTPGEGGELLLIGGNGHGVGRNASPAERVRELTEWTQRIWAGAERTHVWSAQDYETPHRVPFVGWMPRGFGRVYLATGYDKWGMTNAVQAALTLSSDILGGNLPWATTLHHRITTPMAMASGIGANAAVAWWYARGYARVLTRRIGTEPPAEGQGQLGMSRLRPTAVSTVDGVTCAVSAICSHQHAVLGWNDQERSWDCPAHGSRFDADGTLLEGPAMKNLRQR